MRAIPLTSLRRRLVLVIMLTVGPTLALGLAAYVAAELARFRGSVHQELTILADILGEASSAAVEFGDAKEAERLLANLRVHAWVVEAATLDQQGRVVAIYRNGDRGRSLLPGGLPQGSSSFREGQLWLSRPIRHSGETVGSICLRADLAQHNARLRWIIAGGGLLALLLGSASLLLARRMGRLVAEPILRLADAARRMASSQESGQRVARETQDEVGVLVDAFNDMLDKVGERQAGLEEAQRLARLGNWSCDTATGAFSASREAYRITGLEPDATLEQIRLRVHPEDLDFVEARIAHALEQRETFSLDLRLRGPESPQRWIHLAGACFETGPDRRVARGTLMDISERKQAETALLQGQKLESLGVLAGGIAHDFNNLLAALQGFVDLARKTLPEASREVSFLDQASHIVEKAATLVRQMLAYSGRGQFRRRNLDLSALVMEMGHLLSVSISKRARLVYEVAEGIPPVAGDPAQIQQVVMNLVINASDALGDHDGYIQIKTGTETLGEQDLLNVYAGQDLEPGPFVTLEVQDNGHGMDAATMARIFDPFFTTKFQGRGLGLAAMLGIVKGHRGGIKVYSEVGKGTTFRLLFPASDEGADTAPPDPAGITFTGGGEVLLVDDEPSVLGAVAMNLRSMGFHVHEARDGQEGLDRFREHHAHLRLVILDLTMPRMDGFECLKAMRELDPGVPVLLSSGFSEHERREDFQTLGVAGFLQKPYTAAVLGARLREILGD